MVRRALSHRRGTNPLTLDVDTASASASSTPAYVTIPIIVRTATTGRREPSLPLSRHHQMRRSSSVTSTCSRSSSMGRSRSTTASSFGEGGGRELYDGGSVIVDDIDEREEGKSDKERGLGSAEEEGRN